ncbi:MAG: RNA polymerase sigma factor [Gammaproteobacteria bacterium]
MKQLPHNEFAALIAPHLPVLFRAAYRLTGNRPDAEDLLQDVCVRAHAHITSLKSATQPKAWLLKVQYRTFVDGIRRHRRSPLATGEDFDATRMSDTPTPEDAAEGSLAEQRVLDAWRQLDKEQRALLALHVEGYSLAELEAITELSTDALKARLYRARLRLGKLLTAPRTSPALALEE